MHHFSRHRGLELTVANEGNNVVYLMGSKAEQFLYRFCVLVVLPQRVLEFPPISIYRLRPLCLVLPAKYPPLHVFGFDYEYSERRNH